MGEARDHPRSRGEYRGVSPRFQEWGGIIPALAGNTTLGRCYVERGQDHPRSRGEYPTTRTSAPARVGSSPLSRGIRGARRHHRRRHGIIPALAGNTRPYCRQWRRSPDHPRSRGEYIRSTNSPVRMGGSSPLSRGIPCLPPLPVMTPGIIPALAGNTGNGCPLAGRGSDHPRSRGEYFREIGYESPEMGSSPLSRGIHPITLSVTNVDRIIPALAGNTSWPAQ